MTEVFAKCICGNTQKTYTEMRMKMIKTVIFDIGNVMVDFCFRQFIARTGYQEEILDRIEKATLGSGFWNELDRGVMSYEEVLSKFIEK